MSLAPAKPRNLDPRAGRLLEWLGAQPWAHHIVLGGGLALKHYVDYRPTRDCDAWWTEGTPPDLKPQIMDAIAQCLASQNPGSELRRDHWGDVDSIAVKADGVAVFAFQIAGRTRQLESYLPSAWGGMLIESLTDNVASKMAALTERGLGRDFADVRQIALRLGWSPAQFWAVWQRRFPERRLSDAQIKVRLKLEQHIRSRPLAACPSEAQRADLAATRSWFLNEFLAHDPVH